MTVALTIAGSDSGGGAGIQADIKSMQANGVYAASVLTAVTAQNTVAVTDAFELPLALIEKQIDAVFEDLPIRATKTGMLSSAQVIDLVARKLAARRVAPLVVDPVMISKSGFALLADDAIETLKDVLLPLATVVTPNAHEARLLTGIDPRSKDDAADAARAIFELGPGAVLVKGGHIGESGDAVDVLFDGKQIHTFSAPRILTKSTHGTGCTFASAICANLAREMPLRASIARAKRYMTEAIRHAVPLGQGHGPTNHFYFLKDLDVFPIGDG
jgi:hydroxymethylpyrimidine/phosphomethylpyrimidine kinase